MDTDKLKQYAERPERFYEDAGRMPAYSEMLKLFGLKSKNAVFKRVAKLVEAGLVRKDRRGCVLPAHLRRPARLLGFVQAGFPSPAEEETQDLVSLDEYLISNPESTFLLKVEGDSMLGAGINPGDLVLVQRDLSPRPGDIVIARIDNEWTLKYFDTSKGKVTLRAANDKYPVLAPRQELMIGGIVIASVRKYR